MGDKLEFEPIGSRILVRRIAPERIGTIHLPQDTKDTSLVGEVVSIGSECEFVKVGDIILFARYSGCDIPGITLNIMKQEGIETKVDYEKCLAMNEEDILGKLT
jgi:chaperonin GroES